MQAHIRLDSIRFRSLSLAAPVPAIAGSKQLPPLKTTGPVDAESHARRRARQWHGNEAVEEEQGASTAMRDHLKPNFLTASQKRKVAFIRGEFHAKASTCNAYAVWATMNPDISAEELAVLIVKHANNSSFLDLTLRVDRVRSSGKIPGHEEKDNNNDIEEKKQSAAEQKKKVEEEKRTLYFGSLDFEEKEQAVRDLCERLLNEERGPAPNDDGDVTPKWVEGIRLVKDPETGLGKGFAYVLFKVRRLLPVHAA